jgi:hypothetical protein
VTSALRDLECVVPVGDARWVWHYEDEAADIGLSKRPDDLADVARPLILGDIRLAPKREVVVGVNSVDRAVGAARFFGPLFGPDVVLHRARILNRLVAATEVGLGLDGIAGLLDEGAVETDPAEEYLGMVSAYARVEPLGIDAAQLDRLLGERLRQDVPLVEDLPLEPEMETPDFLHLAMKLRMRGLRAFEHWKGNTGVRLADLFQEMAASRRPGVADHAARRR